MRVLVVRDVHWIVTVAVEAVVNDDNVMPLMDNKNHFDYAVTLVPNNKKVVFNFNEQYFFRFFVYKPHFPIVRLDSSYFHLVRCLAPVVDNFLVLAAVLV